MSFAKLMTVAAGIIGILDQHSNAMAVKLMLIILVTSTFFHSVHFRSVAQYRIGDATTTSVNIWSENGNIVDLLQATFNANCSNENGKPYEFQFETENIFFHANCIDKTRKKLTIFSNTNILYVVYFDTDPTNFEEIIHRYFKKNIYTDIIQVTIVNPYMETNVSALYDRLLITNGRPRYIWTNIGSSLNGSLSSGFERTESLRLGYNNIRQLNNDDFQSVTELKDLDLRNNKINKIEANAFNSLVELQILDLCDNELTDLDAVTFQNMILLRILDLTLNKLTTLPDRLFDNLRELGYLYLSDNQLTEISGLILRDLQNVEEIELSHNNLIQIHRDAFNSTIRLITLDLSVNKLTNLTDGLFFNLIELKYLKLSANKLTNVTDGLFDNLRELTELGLSDNRLTEISGRIFRDLQKVRSVDLANNKVVEIHPNAFNNTKNLQFLNLAGNQLTSNDGKFTFLLHLNGLQTLTISYNNLTRIPSELINLNSLRNVNVDLSWDQILSFKVIGMRELNKLKHIRIQIDGYSQCDLGIISFLDGASYTELASQYRKLYSQICTVAPYKQSEFCPVNCECMYHSFRLNVYSEDFLSIRCSEKKLKIVPDTVKLQNEPPILLDISKNNLTELPKWPNNSTVTFILASRNQISKIEVENFPSRLRGLDVSHNNILSIASNVVDHLSQHPSLELIILTGNRFVCACWFEDGTEKLIDFAQQHKSITDFEDPKCDADYELSLEAHEKNCKTKAIALVVIVSIAITSVLIVHNLYKHQQFIKVWLYAHNFCLWWVDEEYLDRDLEFDAFICYSQKDAYYVHALMTALENGTPSYKLFVHDRDFIVGEGIEPQILSSVTRSRRTIIILSKNFIASPWATHEFHCAYSQSIAEKRNRLIVVKHGEIGDNEQLDEVIRSYIQTYTYIESSDKWFWEKIRYALPHKHVETPVEALFESDVEALVESRV